MEGGRESGLCSRQDDGTFEDALRRLNALELKLTEQVKIDIRDLKQTWILPKVDRVTRNAYKLFQVREQLRLSKELFVEEEHILGKFNMVKESLRSSMDEEDFEATKETCMFLGLKLKDIRNNQFRCYGHNKDLEETVNKEIMHLKFQDRDFKELDIEHVRASTPVRQMSPTPLERHRSRSKEPSPFRMPALRIASGSATPGSVSFSRPGSTGSNYQGLETSEDLRRFRETFEAKQGIEDDMSDEEQQSFLFSKAGIMNSDSEQNIMSSGIGGELLTIERPGSALSDMSINIQDENDGSRPGSRMSNVGDVVSTGKFQTSYYQHENNMVEDEVISDIKRKFEMHEKDDVHVNHETLEEIIVATEEEILEANAKILDYQVSASRGLDKSSGLNEAKKNSVNSKTAPEPVLAEEQITTENIKTAANIAIEKKETLKDQNKEKGTKPKSKSSDKTTKNKSNIKEDNSSKVETKNIESTKNKLIDKNTLNSVKITKDPKSSEDNKGSSNKKQRELGSNKEDIINPNQTIKTPVEAKSLLEANDEEEKATNDIISTLSTERNAGLIGQETRKTSIERNKDEGKEKKEVQDKSKTSIERKKENDYPEIKEDKKPAMGETRMSSKERKKNEENEEKVIQEKRKPSNDMSAGKDNVIKRKTIEGKNEDKADIKRKISVEKKKEEDQFMKEIPEKRKASTERTSEQGSIEKRKVSEESKKEGETGVNRKTSTERKIKEDQLKTEMPEKRKASTDRTSEEESKIKRKNSAEIKKDEEAVAKRKTSRDRNQENIKETENKTNRKTSADRNKEKELDKRKKSLDGKMDIDDSNNKQNYKDLESNNTAGQRKKSKERQEKTIASDLSHSESKESEEPLEVNETSDRPVTLKRKSRADFKENKKKNCNDEGIDELDNNISPSKKENVNSESSARSSSKTSNISTFENKNDESIQENNNVLAAIANTTLDAGRSSMLQRLSRGRSEDEFTCRESNEEPADYYPPDNPEMDEDVFMLVLDNDNDVNEQMLSNSMDVDGKTENRRGLEENLAWQRFNSDMSEMEHFKHYNKDSSPDSDCLPLTEEIRGTGFTQLDEFERKLAEMESELQQENDYMGHQQEEVAFDDRYSDCRNENIAHSHEQEDVSFDRYNEYRNENISQTENSYYKSQNNEDLYSVCVPKSQRKTNFTDDGFVINQDSELHAVDHSDIQLDDDTNEAYLSPPRKEEILARSKKVSFAESDERYEIERDAEVKTLGMKLFSFGPPKAMRSLSGEVIDNSDYHADNGEMTTETENHVEKNSAAMEFISVMTGGLIGNKSPDTKKKEAGASVFRSLLRKKTSRSGSKTGSRTSSLDRTSQHGSEDNEENSGQRTSSRGSNYDDEDNRSDSSFVQRLGLRKKKPKKVGTADFDELFARGMAISATLETKKEKRKNEAYEDELLKGTAGHARYDEHGTRFTPFEVYSHEDAFKKTQKEEGIGYAEKVMSYLDDQAHAPRRSVELVGRKDKVTVENKGGIINPAKTSNNPHQLSADKRKRSREYAKPEDIHISPLPKRDLFTGEQIPPSPQSTMLKNITDFVALNEVDTQYSQPVWPATPSKENMPSFREFNHSLQIPRVEVTHTNQQTEVMKLNQGDTGLQNNEMQELPHQLMPDKLMENEAFFEKLRTGLRNISLPPEDNDPASNFQKYSHHLGRAEFGSLRRVESNSSAHSRDASGERKRTFSATRRDLSTEALPQTDSNQIVAKSASTDKVNVGFLQQTNREHYYDKVDKGKRNSRPSSDHGSWSRLSDYSDPLPDLESQGFDDCSSDFSIQNIGVRDDFSDNSSRKMMLKTQSLDVEGYNHQGVVPDLNALAKREVVLRDISNHKQQIREAKAWIQNGLMGAVGFCVVVYLQSLEIIANQ